MFSIETRVPAKRKEHENTVFVSYLVNPLLSIWIQNVEVTLQEHFQVLFKKKSVYISNHRQSLNDPGYLNCLHAIYWEKLLNGNGQSTKINTLIHCFTSIVKWKVSSVRLLHIATNGDLFKVSCSCQWKEEMTRFSDRKKPSAGTQEKWWCWTFSSAHLSIDSHLSATCLLTFNKNWVSLASVFYIISYQGLVFELRWVTAGISDSRNLAIAKYFFVLRDFRVIAQLVNL